MTIRHINAIQFGTTRQARLQGNQTADALNQQVGSISSNTGDLGALQTQVTALNTQVTQSPFFTGVFVSGTSAGGNVEFSVTHSLGRVPQGYIIFFTDKATSLYQGPTTGTAWTTTQIFIKSSTATTSFLIYVT